MWLPPDSTTCRSGTTFNPSPPALSWQSASATESPDAAITPSTSAAILFSLTGVRASKRPSHHPAIPVTQWSPPGAISSVQPVPEVDWHGFQDGPESGQGQSGAASAFSRIPHHAHSQPPSGHSQSLIFLPRAKSTYVFPLRSFSTFQNLNFSCHKRAFSTFFPCQVILNLKRILSLFPSKSFSTFLSYSARAFSTVSLSGHSQLSWKYLCFQC